MTATDGRDALVTALASARVLAIVRYREGGDTLGALRAMAAGGVIAVEVTTQTPGWQDVVASAAAEGIVVGVGTVTEHREVTDASAAGARFIVSPGLLPDVVAAALDRDLEPLPGVATASEILLAQRAGVRLFKLFPAGALGVDYLAQLRGPFPDLAFVPTGGVGLADIRRWLDTGAFGVALGSDLAGRSAPRSDAERAELTRRAAAALAASSQAAPADPGRLLTRAGRRTS
jgi:2-dehydro-3-deoxyphosphogluconate aldolase/(4S)-4-hydroxy-2-oxoglutarate aldolase